MKQLDTLKILNPLPSVPDSLHEDHIGMFHDAFEILSEAVHGNAKAKGFYETPPSSLERLALVHEEISEAVSYVRHGNPPSDHIPEFSGVEEELADAVIRIMDMAEYQGLNVAGAIIAKIEYNRSRPYKHGKLL